MRSLKVLFLVFVLFFSIFSTFATIIVLVVILIFFGVEIIMSFFMGNMVRILAGSIAGSIGKALSSKLK